MNPQVKILLVDDSEESLVALEAVLKPLQQRLYRARSGPEAMKLLLRHDVAVVLLDVLMPGMDGFETAAHIKRLDQTRDVPIIFLTAGEPGAGAAFRGYAVGAADYLTKPFDPWVLRSKVSVFIDLFRKNTALRERTGTPARTPARMVEDASGDAGALTGFAERLGLWRRVWRAWRGTARTMPGCAGRSANWCPKCRRCESLSTRSGDDTARPCASSAVSDVPLAPWPPVRRKAHRRGRRSGRPRLARPPRSGEPRPRGGPGRRVRGRPARRR